MKSFFKTIIWLAVFVLVLNRGMSQSSGNISYATTTTMMAPHVAQYSETSTATETATTTTAATASQTAIPTFVPEKVWTLDEIRRRVNSVTGASIPMEDYVVSSDVRNDYLRLMGYYDVNTVAFFDYSSRKIYLDNPNQRYFPLLAAHESCHYLLNQYGCRQMIGNYGDASGMKTEEAFCDVFAYRLFSDVGALHGADCRINSPNRNCVDTYIANIVSNCRQSNRFTCDISVKSSPCDSVVVIHGS